MQINFYIGYLFIGKTKWLGGVKLEIVFYDKHYYHIKKNVKRLRRKLEAGKKANTQKEKTKKDPILHPSP
jgi:hypothetical protein